MTSHADLRARHVDAASLRLRRRRRCGPHDMAGREPGARCASSPHSSRIPELYIADGHHRAASAWRTRAELEAGRVAPPRRARAGVSDTFLAVAFPDDQMQVLPYHRLVNDLHGLDAPRGFSRRAPSRLFEFVDGPPQPTAKGQLSIYLDGSWSDLPPSPLLTASRPIENLDCNILQEQVLTPLLDIGDPRTDKRIDFVGGIRGTQELDRRVDAGRGRRRLLDVPGLRRRPVRGFRHAGEIMPPKSTWFEPKLRDGLLDARDLENQPNCAYLRSWRKTGSGSSIEPSREVCEAGRNGPCENQLQAPAVPSRRHSAPGRRNGPCEKICRALDRDRSKPDHRVDRAAWPKSGQAARARSDRLRAKLGHRSSHELVKERHRECHLAVGGAVDHSSDQLGSHWPPG